MMTADNSMAVIEDTTNQVLIGGVSHEIKPVVLGQIPAVIKVGKAMFADILPLIDMDENEVTESIIAEYSVNILSDHGDDAIKAFALLSGLGIDKVRGLDLEETVNLAKAIWAVNRGFFETKLAPMLSPALKERISAAASQLAPTTGATTSQS